MIERRQTKRCAIIQLIDITLMQETDLQAETVNISEGGMLCRSGTPVEPLTRVYLMLRLPGEGDDYIMKVEGSVMHATQDEKGCLFGIAFGPMTTKDKEALRQYLANSCSE